MLFRKCSAKPITVVDPFDLTLQTVFTTCDGFQRVILEILPTHNNSSITLFIHFKIVWKINALFPKPLFWPRVKTALRPSALRLAENGKKRPIHGKSAQGVTEP